MAWTVEFYCDESGREPVVKFLDSLPVDARAKVTRLLELLARYGVLLKEPYTKQVRGKVRELRVMDPLGAVRVFYFAYTGKRLVLLHGFLKKTAKTPMRELDMAELRMQEFLVRNGGAK